LNDPDGFHIPKIMPETNDLSEREREILRLVATGASNKEIAQALFISSNTVKVHLRNIFAKIGVTSRTEAAMYAVNAGLVPGARPGVSSPTGQLPDVDTTSDQVLPDQGSSQPTRRRLAWGVVGLLVLVIMALLAWGAFFNRQPAGQASVPTPAQAALPRWETLAPMPTARQGLALAAYEGQLYAIGGQAQDGVTGVVERYNPSMDEWQTLVSKPTPVADIEAVVVGGKIYVPCGRLAAGDSTDVLEIFDPRTGAWEKGAPLPVALSAYALVAFEGRLYLFGGWDGIKYFDTAYQYDPSVDAWKSLPPMPVPRAFTGAAPAGGKIFVIGGRGEKGPLDSNQAFQPGADAGASPWVEVAPLPEARYAMGVTSVADFIHVVGGLGTGKDALPSLEYLPSTNTWRMVESAQAAPLSDLGLAAMEGFIYQAGGNYQNAPTAGAEKFQALFTISIPLVR
jgi:DNA-binding CsgD family transcriptional regulator/N-acetylneuraminic acid mutarotase